MAHEITMATVQAAKKRNFLTHSLVKNDKDEASARLFLADDIHYKRRHNALIHNLRVLIAASVIVIPFIVWLVNR